MESQLKIFFCIVALHQISAFPMTVHIDILQGNTFLPFMVERQVSEGAFGNDNFTITFIREVSEENDMPIHFEWLTQFDMLLNSNINNATLCKDKESVEGTAVSLVSRSLGMPTLPPCPIANGTQFYQEEYFPIDHKDYPQILYDPVGSGLEAFMIAYVDGYKVLSLTTLIKEEDLK